jgi:two-component system OmpR family sensor kinase
MFSIKTKIIAAYTVAFGLLVSAFAMIIYESTWDAEVAKLDARLESHADKIQTELEEDGHQPGFPNRAGLDSIYTEGLKGTKIRLLTLDYNVVFADPGFDIGTRMKWNSGVAAAVQKGTAKWSHHKYRLLQWPVELDDRVEYVVQVAEPLHDIDETMDRLLLLFLIAIPGSLLLAGCAAYFITRLAFRPMMNMVRTAGNISASSLDERLELPLANDEVRQLGNALNEMLERIDKTVKAQRQFIADASHELRTPITIIRTELESSAGSVRSKPLKASVATSLGQLDRLTLMIGDLLMLAKLDSAKLKFEKGPVRLDELVLECVQAAKGLAKKNGVKLKVFIEEAVEMTGDFDKLKSAMYNLLENAIKYSARKSSVMISLVRGENSATASIIIRDHGIGIPETEQAKIFGRFYRGAEPRSATEGSGLGLAIAQRFVELHGGSISVKSQEGKGATFTVELPLSMQPPDRS